MTHEFDPAEVEAVTGRALPRLRRLRWRLVDHHGAIELLIESAVPSHSWGPVRVPAAWIPHLEALVLRGLDDMDCKLEELPLDDDDNFVVAALAGYTLLLTSGANELWISLTRAGREIASAPWVAGGDFYGALASARVVLMHYGLFQPPGPAN